MTMRALTRSDEPSAGGGSLEPRHPSRPHPSQVDRWAPADRARHRMVSPMAAATPAAVVAAGLEAIAADDGGVLREGGRAPRAIAGR